MNRVTPSHYCFSRTKRFLDIAVSICMLVFAFPLGLIIALCIVLDSPGSIFFSQIRKGRKNHLFRIYKFRTMYVGAEKDQPALRAQNESPEPTFKLKHDPRHTRFGKILSKTGLDELPQLWNVLRGEMSIVGPRPLPVNEASLLPPGHIREQVRPGLLSSWVMKKNRSKNIQELLTLDEQDSMRASIWFDCTMIWKYIRFSSWHVRNLLLLGKKRVKGASLQ